MFNRSILVIGVSKDSLRALDSSYSNCVELKPAKRITSNFMSLMMKVRPDPISTVLTTMVFILPSNKWTDSSWIKMECLTAIFIKSKVTPAPQTIRDQLKSQTDLMSPTSSEVIEIKTPALTGGVKISTLINTLATESSSRVSTTTTSLTVRITIITITLKLINFRFTLGTLT